jgi:hypothetical protein
VECKKYLCPQVLCLAAKEFRKCYPWKWKKYPHTITKSYIKKERASFNVDNLIKIKCSSRKEKGIV